MHFVYEPALKYVTMTILHLMLFRLFDQPRSQGPRGCYLTIHKQKKAVYPRSLNS